ncbi:DNA polymerase delta, subunit 4-domain-containing protein [Lasiosphaeria ovina]|uniref:DNA polymerase delta, subunit 4-domain-containing protein n=1 Tax=Lasiosphaeria ovina TaxID=92902 RepID=A0AAE0JT32_9PEZI|nr:DNA polymerase delta, subunit 4-domain-containing protein [Lasiosphaeria ovina]
MPVTRKSTRSSGPPKGQSTLSFNHRVTKSVPKSAKDSLLKPSSLSKEIPPEPEADSPPQTTDIEVEKEEAPQQVKQESSEEAAEKSDAEFRADRISDASIERYWGKIEASRQARATHRKHTEGLTTGEKLLRYFDVSSQYGPCIGIDRTKRWQRAEKLGLNPPIEVLAVLRKDESKGDAKIERAHMDEILNSTAIGV